MTWRNRLPALLTERSFPTQGHICAFLEAEGHEITQGTLSRALRELGAVKVSGAYRLPAAEGTPILQVQWTASDCLAVIHTEPAYASLLGQRLDDAGLAGVLGTVAGDDTVFVATDGKEGPNSLCAFLGLKRRGRA